MQRLRQLFQPFDNARAGPAEIGVAVDDVHAPVPDRRLYDTIYEERYMGLPKDQPKAYTAGSPITHAKSLQGNLLLIHGTGDDNVHFQATERLVDALVHARCIGGVNTRCHAEAEVHRHWHSKVAMHQPRSP